MRQQFPRPGRRLSAGGAVAAALAVGVAVGVGATPADAATTVRVRSVVRTQVAVSQAYGAIVTIIHVCPVGSDLDRPMTKSLIARTPPGYRLLSRELWPRGMVTRWRQSGPLSQFDNPPLPHQTVACVRSIQAGAARSTANISVTVRLWGPAPVKAELNSWHSPSSTWNGRPAKSTVVVRDFASRRMAYAQAGSDFPDEAFGYGFIAGPYSAGRFAELKVYLTVTARRP